MKTVFKLGLLISSLWSSLVLAEHNGAHVNVEVPPLSPRAAQGQVVFNDNCASCHGVNAQGGASGPPLIHDIYNPRSPRQQSLCQRHAKRCASPSLAFWQHALLSPKLV